MSSLQRPKPGIEGSCCDCGRCAGWKLARHGAPSLSPSTRPPTVHSCSLSDGMGLAFGNAAAHQLVISASESSPKAVKNGLKVAGASWLVRGGSGAPKERGRVASRVCSLLALPSDKATGCPSAALLPPRRYMPHTMVGAGEPGLLGRVAPRRLATPSPGSPLRVADRTILGFETCRLCGWLQNKIHKSDVGFASAVGQVRTRGPRAVGSAC